MGVVSIPPSALSCEDLGQVGRPIPALFHPPSPSPLSPPAGAIHLAMNGLSLANLGPALEHRMGAPRFAAVYLSKGGSAPPPTGPSQHPPSSTGQMPRGELLHTNLTRGGAFRNQHFLYIFGVLFLLEAFRRVAAWNLGVQSVVCTSSAEPPGQWAVRVPGERCCAPRPRVCGARAPV